MISSLHFFPGGPSEIEELAVPQIHRFHFLPLFFLLPPLFLLKPSAFFPLDE